MYPLSFSRLKHIEKSVPAFLYACIKPDSEPSDAMQLGTVIHRALLFGDYKQTCKQDIDASLYPSTIEDMIAIVGNLGSKARKADYENACADAGVTTLSMAKQSFDEDTRPCYKLSDVDMIDGLVQVTGNRFTDGDKEAHLKNETIHGHIDWLSDNRLTDIKTRRDSGKDFYLVCAQENYLEQLALYYMLAPQVKELSIYDVVIGEGYAYTNEYVFDVECDAVKEATERVRRWINAASDFDGIVKELVEQPKFIVTGGREISAGDNSMPMFFYREGMKQ